MSNSLGFDPLNLCVVKLDCCFNDEVLTNATGFFYSAMQDGKDITFLITNWHILSGYQASDNSKPLHLSGGIPNNIKFKIPISYTSGQLIVSEQIINLYDSEGVATWFQHPLGSQVDIGLINVGNAFNNSLIKHADEVAANYDMAIEVGDDVIILGYPLGFSHIANTPIWKKGSIASEPHAETADSKHRIVIDATTRSGMSGSPVFIRYKSHYLTETGEIKMFRNATRFIGVYASRPPPSEDKNFSYIFHEIGYVYKSGPIEEIAQSGIRGPHMR